VKIGWICFLLIGCTTGMAVIPEESGTIEAFFCDKIDCEQVFTNVTKDATSLDCAFYNMNDGFAELLGDARVVVDGRNPRDGFVVESGPGLMHNKFCIINREYVWTGSWNPSQEMSIANNAVLVKSATVVNAYQEEFDELYRGNFHGGKSSPAQVFLNGQLMEMYFCPEDKCKEHVMEVLDSAQESIHFMTFAFTDDDIADLLLKKSEEIGVRGVFGTHNSKYSEFEKLEHLSTKTPLHHKVFIIDSTTVITGSYNPSKNGNTQNDENVLIIRDSAIAEQFEKEFERFI